MKLMKLCAIALAAIATIPFVNASHSVSPCPSEVTTIDSGAGATLYVVSEGVTESLWIYAESNGHAGLQRGGFAWYELGTGNGVDDTCWDVDLGSGEQIENPDMIVF